MEHQETQGPTTQATGQQEMGQEQEMGGTGTQAAASPSRARMQGITGASANAGQTQAAAPEDASLAIASHAGESAQATQTQAVSSRQEASAPNASIAAANARPPATIRGENTIYIGKKNAMSYVLAVITQFNAGAREVRVKARGRAISRAVDVTQIVKNRFMPGAQIAGVDLTTEEVQSEDGSVSKVSSMEVRLTR